MGPSRGPGPSISCRQSMFTDTSGRSINIYVTLRYKYLILNLKVTFWFNYILSSKKLLSPSNLFLIKCFMKGTFKILVIVLMQNEEILYDD